MALQSLRNRLAITFHRSAIVLQSPCNHLAITLQPPRNRFAIDLQSLCRHFAIFLLRNRSAITLLSLAVASHSLCICFSIVRLENAPKLICSAPESLRDRFTIALVLLFYRVASISPSICDRSAIELPSLCNRSADAIESL
jgi:hypothetical protein